MKLSLALPKPCHQGMMNPMPEMPKVPDGWSFAVVPGWPTNQVWKSTLERAGNVLLPQAFTAIVSADDKSETVFLCMVVQGGEVKMGAVMSTYSDVPTGLDRVRRAAPMHVWKRLAIAGMAHWLATADPDEIDQDFAVMTITHGTEWWAEATRVWQRQLAGAAESNAEKAASVPVRRKRNRITREHLEAVARVYREADANGAPPTRAVQKAFDTTHSTAAKWVAQARKQGILGAPPGARGGEVGNPAALAAARPIAEAAARPIAERVRKAAAESLRHGEMGESKG